MQLNISTNGDFYTPKPIWLQSTCVLGKGMEVASAQWRRQPRQKSGEPSSMVAGLGRKEVLEVHSRTRLQGSSNRNMLGAFPSLPDQVMHKIPCIVHLPMCLWLRPQAAPKPSVRIFLIYH